MSSPRIFVSYAHIDNEVLLDTDAGWVSSLHRMLEVRLAQLLGEKPSIWRDPQLIGNAVITDSLIEQLSATDYMICIMSPRYLKSEWCLREIETFFAQSGQPNRIFKVIKTQIEPEQHPKMVRDCLSYNFFRNDRDSGRPKELRPNSSATAQDFIDCMDDLAFDLCQTIQQLSALPTIDAETDANSTTDDEQLTVYLATTSIALEDQRNLIRRELLDRGYRVLPQKDLPFRQNLLEDEINQCLDSSDLAIHLFDDAYGMIPEGSKHSIIETQEILTAKRVREHGLPRIVYLNDTAPGEDPRQICFLERLETANESWDKTDFLRCMQDELQEEIYDKLTLIETTKAKAANADDNNPADSHNDQAQPASIYILCNEVDLEAAEQLDQYLYDQHLEPVLPLFDGDAAELEDDHQRNLANCDNLLIYQGEASDAWLRKVQHQLPQGDAQSSPQNIKNIAIFAGPPLTNSKRRLRSRTMDIIQSMNTLDPQVLQTFIKRIQSS
ncbi:MAG: hypothetical protein ACI8WB_000377 [Phenylobacterium sp.]|jgi:hypothetical protein